MTYGSNPLESTGSEEGLTGEEIETRVRSTGQRTASDDSNHVILRDVMFSHGICLR